MVWILLGEEPLSDNLNMPDMLPWPYKAMQCCWIQNKMNLILKYKKHKVETEHPWFKSYIYLHKSNATWVREEELREKKTGLSKKEWKQSEANTEPRRPKRSEASSAFQGIASPDHWSNYETTNAEGSLPGFSNCMWKALQIVFWFIWVVFLQNKSLLVGSRRNPAWRQKQMGKCLTTSRLSRGQ